jgi:hypothetical protein
MRNTSAIAPQEEGEGIAPPLELAMDEEMLRQVGYQVMDEVAAYLGGIRERPVWQAMPENIHHAIREQQLPAEGQPFAETLAFIKTMILPFKCHELPTFTSRSLHDGKIFRGLESRSG